MAVWELIVEAMSTAQTQGREWLKSGEIVSAVHDIDETVNTGTISWMVIAHCINVRGKG